MIFVGRVANVACGSNILDTGGKSHKPFSGGRLLYSGLLRLIRP
jgi:hypothetical protein